MASRRPRRREDQSEINLSRCTRVDNARSAQGERKRSMPRRYRSIQIELERQGSRFVCRDIDQSKICQRVSSYSSIADCSNCQNSQCHRHIFLFFLFFFSVSSSIVVNQISFLVEMRSRSSIFGINTILLFRDPSRSNRCQDSWISRSNTRFNDGAR